MCVVVFFWAGGVGVCGCFYFSFVVCFFFSLQKEMGTKVSLFSPGSCSFSPTSPHPQRLLAGIFSEMKRVQIILPL